MPQTFSRLFAVFFATLLLLAGTLAHAAPTTPTADFTDNNDGTVTHKITGLTWKRCSEGQTWSGGTCTGTATVYTWAQATALTGTFAGKSDWRLPTIAELVTIVERNATKSATNATVFPATPTSHFWSASIYAGGADRAWYAEFYAGADGPDVKTSNAYVRLVRGGQIFDPWSSSGHTPTADFTDNKDGTVTHKKTNLTWKRCAEKQTWTGSSCNGTAGKVTWDNAVASAAPFAGQSDWRLPTQNELLTIVEWSATNPAINATTFPSTPSDGFWSASLYAGSSVSAWFVGFGDGSGNGSVKTVNYYVRLVRSGSASSTADLNGLTVNCPATLAANGSGSCSATATYSDGSSKSVVPSWSLSGGVATINSSGALSGGTVTGDTLVTVTATYSEGGFSKTATANITVKAVAPTLSDLIIVCPAKTVSGDKDQCTATAVYKEGQAKPVLVTWTSSNPSALTADQAGNLSGTPVTTAVTVTLTATYTEGNITLVKQANIEISPSPLGACAGSKPYTMLLTLNGAQTPTPLAVKGGDGVEIHFCMANFDGATLLDVYIAASVPSGGDGPLQWYVATPGLLGINWATWDFQSVPARFLTKQAIQNVNARQIIKIYLPATWPNGTTSIYAQALPYGRMLLDTASWSKLWGLGSVSFTY